MASNMKDDTTEGDNTGQGMYELGAEGWRQRAEKIFKEMQPPSIQALPKEDAFKIPNFKNQPDCNTAEAWNNCTEAIEKHDANTCKAHREEIDTLLVFAGLFSAVVTAFTIESYQWLQSDPNDAIIVLLSQIARAENQSQTFPAPAGLPNAASARINAYWFLSLTLSLASALVAILCKQWVREFERRGDQTPELFIGVRQTKLEGFEGWGVASVVAAVPLLLQSALGLFALGLIELLWILHTAVAIVVLIPTLAALIFYGVTTLLPGLQLLCDPYGALVAVSQCPFKSPQALLTLRMLTLLRRHASCPRVICTIFEFVYRHCLVFCRRVHACFCPDYLARRYPSIVPTVPVGDATRHSFWLRIRAPWQYPELKFYEHSTDRPSWYSFCRWCKRHLPFYRRSQDRVAGRALHSLFMLPPTSFESWVTLDRGFATSRDTVYDYTRAFEEDGGHLPPRACFRGLAWLRAQLDHPGLPQWVWLCIWNLAVQAEYADKAERENQARFAAITQHVDGADDAARAAERAAEAERIPCNRDALHFCHAMRHLFRITLHEETGSSQPIALALYFGILRDMNTAVLGELFVHILPHLKLGIAPYMWSRLRDSLGNQQDIWHSALRAVLDQLLCNDPRSRRNGPTFLFTSRETELHSWDRSLGPDWDLMTPSELACVIALRFQELRSLNGDSVDDHEFPYGLVDATLTSAAANQGGPHYSAAVQPTFSALAFDFDRWLEQAAAQGNSVHLPNKWFEEQYRRVYFNLLHPEQGDVGTPPSSVVAAEERLVRQLSDIRQVRGYTPSPGSWWGLFEYVKGWPALRDAVFGAPDSTEDTPGPSSVGAAEERLVRQLSRMEDIRRAREYTPSPGSWDGNYEYVKGWPALRAAVLDPPDSTEDAPGPSASTNEPEPSEA